MISEGQVPGPLADRPEVDETIADAWRAFREAGRDRQCGVGLGPIPYTSILRWMDEEGITDRNERETLKVLVLAADDEYRATVSDREERERKSKEKDGKAGF